MNGVIIYLRTKTVCNAGLFACQGPKPGSHPRFACPSIDQAASAATVHGLLNSSHLPLLENMPKVLAKVPAAVAADTNATHQYRLQKQLVPLASDDQR